MNPSENLSFLDDIDNVKIESDESVEYDEEILRSDISEEFQEPSNELHKDGTDKSDDKPKKEILEKFETVDFIVKGTRTWNTREPYIAPLIYKKLESDYKSLNNTFYFIQNLHN